MAKYDQGGGCPCGFYKICVCGAYDSDNNAKPKRPLSSQSELFANMTEIGRAHV